MVVAHIGSLSLGDHGIFYLDDQTYLYGGTFLAHSWRGGHTPDPAAYNVLGTYQFGYQFFLGAIFTLGTPSILLGKLANVLLGGVSVYLTGRLGGRLLGERAKQRAAWIAALAPGMVWWSATMMKETVSTALLLLGVLAVLDLPRRRALVTLALVLAALAVVRLPAAVALTIGAGAAAAIAGRRAEGRLLSRPLIVFGWAVAAGLIVVAVVVSHGHVGELVREYDIVVPRMFHTYQGGDLTRLPVDIVKSLVTPAPWAFDIGTRNWDRMLYPGVWLLISVLPLALLGAWRLRRSPEGWVVLVIAATALLLNVGTAGFVFRQRSMIEPLIFLLALAGATSWRMAGRSAAFALGIAAVVAGVSTRSVVVASVVAGAAGVILLVSRRLSAERFDPPPESRLVASFRSSIDADPPSRRAFPLRLIGEAAWAARTLGVWATDARAAVGRRMPDTSIPGISPSSGPIARAAVRVRDLARRSAPPLTAAELEREAGSS
jgi:hypothetical protein